MLDTVSQARRVDIAREIYLFNLFLTYTTVAHLAGYFSLTSLLNNLYDLKTHPVDVYTEDSKGKTALWYACLYGHLDAMI